MKKHSSSSITQTLLSSLNAKQKLHLLVVTAIIILALSTLIGLGSRFFVDSRMTQLGLKSIGEMATQAGYYTNVEVLEDSKTLWKITLPFTSSKYIFSYDGIIKAGIDFQELDWTINDITKTISVSLPEARILTNEIDPESLYVYDESRSIFSPLTVENLNESLIALRSEAEEKAVGNGILGAASENAKLLIRGLLAGNYPEYEIIFDE